MLTKTQTEVPVALEALVDNLPEVLQEAFKGMKVVDYRLEYRYHHNPIFMMGEDISSDFRMDTEMTIVVHCKADAPYSTFVNLFTQGARLASITDMTSWSGPMGGVVHQYNLCYSISDSKAFKEGLKEYEYRVYSRQFDLLMEEELNSKE